MKNHGLFRKWYLSYLIIVCIALFFSIGIYNLFASTMESEISKLNSAYLSQIKGLIDGEIQSIDQTAHIIGLTPTIQSVINMEEELTIDDRYVLREALKNLKLYNTSNDLSKNIYLYVFKPGLLITNESVYTSYLDLFTTEQFNVDADLFRRIVKRNYQREINRFNYLTGEGDEVSKLLYLQSLPINYKSSMTATLVIELDESRISKVMGEDEYLSEGLLCILDSQNRLIFSKGDLSFPNGLKYEELSDHQVIRDVIDGHKVAISSLESDVTDVKYVRIVPESLFWKEARKLKNKTICIIILLGLVGIILGYLFTKKYYKPLNKIVHRVKPEMEEEIVGNEYQYIEDALDHNFEIQKQMKCQLSRQNKVFKNNFLARVLKGKIEDEEELRQQLKAYDIQFTDKHFVVMAFQIHDLSRFSKSKNVEHEWRLARFIIGNIFHEVMSKQNKCTIVESEEILACILSDITFAKEEYYPGYLTDIIQEAYQPIKDNFNIDFTVAISFPHDSLMGISEAYREALDALAYTKILGNVDTIFYGDTLQSKRKYDYSIEKEHQVINLIKVGNYEKAKDLLDEILDQHLMEDLISLEAVQCLMFDLLSSIIKTINGFKEQKILDDLKPIKKMMKCHSVEEMRKVLDHTLSEICMVKKLELNNDESNDLSKRVKEFILEHYYDTDLNVSMLGEHFNMTPAYLSKLFKQDTGDSLLNTINKVRIDHAKKLLEETDETIGQVANKVGYTYSNAFIRVFKKYEGVTPGQYKSVL
ncbi:helix-turn-helix domain-containing protein [Vallitalea okinawensis]|uniref:helix-turn-helix domain-containing protein n=1 Tax=Vallitalea okinawensis TaxID=2078660 RepID=UPI0014784E24|nr:helix-turn-helix domain-containing protein [Vallitalea okinawensis]